ncbi:MAG: hypothetical protein ACK5Y2_01320 [Bdellovibrionales bacterium]
MPRLALLVLSVGFPLFLQAQMSDAGSQPPKPFSELVMRDGRAHFVLQDGREAALFVNFGQKERFSVGLTQIENTCRPEHKLTKCQFEMDLLPHELSIRWTKNADPTRIGQPVTIRFQGNDEQMPLIDSQALLTRYSSPSKLKSQFQPDRIKCGDMTWLRDAQEIRPSVYRVNSWGGELMFENDETGVNENQTWSSLINLELEQKDAQSAVIINYGRTVPEVLNSFIPFLTQGVSSLSYLSKSGQVCQVAFQVEAGGLIQALEDLLERQTYDPKNRVLLDSGLRSRIITDAESTVLLRPMNHNFSAE